MAKTALDAIDRKILKYLIKNARMPFLEIARECKPKMIVAGASAYARKIDFKRCREIADEVGAYLMVDMAHIGGLVAAGVHPSPVPYADVVTCTTHKTLRGPRGAIILCRDELAKKIDSAVFPGTQGGPLMHVIAGKAVAFGEALAERARRFARGRVLSLSPGGDIELPSAAMADTVAALVYDTIRKSAAPEHDIIIA